MTIAMQIYYSYIDKYYNNSSLTKREKERLLGRKIVLDVAKSVYGVEDEIVYDGKRPHFKNDGIHFSISHSENLVVVAFDDEPVGIDVEFVKPRDFEKLARRYGIKIETLADFYKWWTSYEAKYKNPNGKFVTTFELLPEYICSIVTPEKQISEEIDKKCYANFSLNL